MFTQVRDYLVAGFAVAALISSIGWRVTSLSLEAEKSGRAADKAVYEAAQQMAKAKALEEKQKIEKEYNEKAKKADAIYDALLAKYSSAVVRYKANQSPAIRADLPASSGSAEGADRPGRDSEFYEGFFVRMADAQVCAVNTARLQSAREWALSISTDKTKENPR